VPVLGADGAEGADVVPVSVWSGVVPLFLPRLLGVVGTPRSAGDFLELSLPPPPALAINTITSTNTAPPTSAAIRRRRL
jgi:hypothetical protein